MEGTTIPSHEVFERAIEHLCHFRTSVTCRSALAARNSARRRPTERILVDGRLSQLTKSAARKHQAAEPCTGAPGISTGSGTTFLMPSMNEGEFAPT